MFILSFKLDRGKVITVATVSVLALIIGLIILFQSGTKNIFDTLKTGLNYNFSGMKTNEDRMHFLEQFGWKVDQKPIEVMEVQIPEEFDSVYQNYNKIQGELGLDLKKYKGQRVKRYTYKVLNYPNNDKDEIRANVLIYKERVIAGDIMTTALDGFMHSLLYKQ